MRLLKLIVYGFIIYFIVRFVQMYRMYKAKALQNEANQNPENGTSSQTQKSDPNVVDADFKKID